MDYHQWKRQLLENPRVETVPQGVEQNPTLDKIRKAGDVGKREVVSRVQGRQVTPQEYPDVAAQTAADAGVVNWTDGQQPGDADDLEFVRQQALMRYAPDYAQAKSSTNKELENLPNIEDLPLQDRMAKSFDAIAPMGGATRDKNVNDAMNDAIRASESPNARGTIQGGEAGEIDDIRYQRHKLQPELELGYEITPDEVANLIAITADQRDGMSVAQRGDMKGQTRASLQNKRVGENPLMRGEVLPSGRDIENLNPEAMQQALEDGKITEEQFERQMRVLTALRYDDAAGLQDALFQHEVSDEAIDAFYQNAQVPSNLSTRGLTSQPQDSARWRKAYGGNLPSAMDKFKVKGAPDGVYDLYEMSKDPAGRKYLSQAMKNREREVIRTWLRQGGRDAYAHHEGVRSLLDMNLEHIQNIAGDGNYDHPSNWVWASEDLNKLKNEYNLIDKVDEFAQDKTERSYGEYTPQTFADIRSKQDKEQQATWKAAFPEFRGGNTKIGSGGMSLERYDEFTADQIADFRNRAIDLGYSKKEAEQIFPEVTDKVVRKGYMADPERYEEKRQATENRAILLQTFAERLKSRKGYKKQRQALESPEGQEFTKRLDAWVAENGQLPEKPEDVFETGEFDQL